MVQSDEAERASLFEGKECIFITSRVHCGETPGPYMLQGMLDLLMDESNP
jgi:hypothetical protein